MNEEHVHAKGSFEKHFQSVLLTIIAALILTGVLKLFKMSEEIVRIEERERPRTEKIDNLQFGMDKIRLDMIEVKDRMYKVEYNQTSKNKSR